MGPDGGLLTEVKRKSGGWWVCYGGEAHGDLLTKMVRAEEGVKRKGNDGFHGGGVWKESGRWSEFVVGGVVKRRWLTMVW